MDPREEVVWPHRVTWAIAEAINEMKLTNGAVLLW